METDTLYSTAFPGIGGKIKTRYADFIVEELWHSRTCTVEHFIAQGFPAAHQAPMIPKVDQRKYLHLDLEKINRDVNSVVKRLARFVHLSKKSIGYAGLKDKRGITCQRISLFNPDPELVQAFHCPGVHLAHPTWEAEAIRIGDHAGNRFTVTIRGLAGSEEHIQKTITRGFEEMVARGIAAFFGEQRFGGMRAITHVVGEHILKGAYEAAVMTYLTTTFQGEKQEIQEIRARLAIEHDFGRAAKEFPKECGFERALCAHLHQHPEDFAGALSNIPRSMRYLFTHALQSKLFNEIIAARIREGMGLHAHEGDILEQGIPTAPLFGYDSEFAQGKPGEIEQRILQHHGLELHDFRVKELPELSSRGTRKPVCFSPIAPEIIKISDDDFFPGTKKACIRFSLGKGLYATTLLRELMKEKT